MDKNLITIEAEGHHVAWNNELNEINEELKQFELILSKISAPTNKKEIEHFQNQFLIQRSAIAKIKNEIKKHDFAIERGGNEPFDKLKTMDVQYHEMMSEKIDIEIKIIAELKLEFADFIENQKQ